MIRQLTTVQAFFMIAAVMEPPHACRHSPRRSSAAVATLPASGASCPGSAGGGSAPRRAPPTNTAPSCDGTVSGAGAYGTSGGPFAYVMTWEDARKVPGRCGNTDLAGADEPLCFAVNETSHYKEHSDGISSFSARRGRTFPRRPPG
jgi:hypothetical protein